MTEASPSPSDAQALLQPAQAAEAAQLDPVGWHHIQVLTERTRTQTGLAQVLLQAKLNSALAQLQARLAAQKKQHIPHIQPTRDAPSPLSALLRDMSAPSAERPLSPGGHGRMDKPHIVQFRQQLGKMSVQKKVTQAIAQAPQNAGPINSHMLVLRSLGLMRDLSPDYLNRFMGYVDTLLFLDMPQTVKATPKKAVPASKSER
ncbi:DUF2894 domain-containing protein [Limnohabitans sp. 2KL-51]|uniref:DUF2894 domain-containing protein n=1 Tax=Limnohabitans sp. 2KL-51 TaxID=1977911 RepID=UPI000D38292A|nr:DUF2894 domain-containing protein [Limnohabitans sp. 2KL-51]PUE46555.1 hypothetical protein B9Z49_12740 [Limnohabitans sp. 2KL-51]